MIHLCHLSLSIELYFLFRISFALEKDRFDPVMLTHHLHRLLGHHRPLLRHQSLAKLPKRGLAEAEVAKNRLPKEAEVVKFVF